MIQFYLQQIVVMVVIIKHNIKLYARRNKHTYTSSRNTYTSSRTSSRNTYTSSRTSSIADILQALSLVPEIMYTIENFYLEEGTEYLGFSDQETINSIKDSTEINRKWEEEKTYYTVIRGLTKNEYVKMKKDLQPIIDDLKNQINQADVKIWLEIKQKRLIAKKELINKYLTPISKEARMDIARAKEYPITELIEFKHKKARCIFHEEKTPSLHYCAKNNKAHCFGRCGKSFDSIDVYRIINNVDFATAVKALQ